MSTTKNKISILGCRGIPASHGGFETFAEKLSLYLVQEGWDVTVYCQKEGHGPTEEDYFQNIRRINIYVKGDNSLSTILFDFKATLHASKEKNPILLLGYNTAVFNTVLKLNKIPVLTNMDGIEYHRQKWSTSAKLWFRINERFGAWFSDHLIADHPKIKEHLAQITATKNITMIPYGADIITSAKDEYLSKWNLTKNQFALLIARPEPENSILEIIKAYSSRKTGYPLVVLGKYKPHKKEYHKKVMQAASDEVLFIGAIYDQNILDCLRLNCRFYFHGHQVGGTNPSLVEALGASSAIIAHDNHFNRWVAGNYAQYFSTIEECCHEIKKYYENDSLIKDTKKESFQHFSNFFMWESVLSQYKNCILKQLNQSSQ